MARIPPLHIRQAREARRAAVLRRAAEAAYLLSWVGPLAMLWRVAAFPQPDPSDAPAWAWAVWWAFLAASPSGIGLAAVSLGALALTPPPRTGRNSAVAAVVVGVGGLALVGIAYPMLVMQHSMGGVSCLSNMK